MMDVDGSEVRATSARIAVLASALTCVLLAVSARPATAAYPGRNGKITYDAGGISRIFAIDPFGTEGRRRLSPNGLFGYGPAYSPDGRRLAFTGVAHPYGVDDENHIYVMDADGSGLRRLTREEDVSHVSPTFSPDGRRIAFTRNAGAGSELYTMEADGANSGMVTRAGSGHAFSPDGRRFVLGDGSGRPPGLYSVRTDGTGERRLTEDTRRQMSPDFSPDGRRIVFVRVRGTAGFCCQGAIYVVNSDGRNPRRLTGRTLDSNPVFSPDGRKIVFERFVRPGLTVLWTMNSDGTSRRALRGGRVKGSAPTWQPLVGRPASR